MLAAMAAMLLPIEQAAAKATSACAPGGVKVLAGASPATVTVNDTTTGTGVQVVVTITGTTFAVTPVDSGVTLTGATWCLKASTKLQTGTGTTGTSTITNRKGVAQKISYLIVYGVTSQAPEPPSGCSGTLGTNANGQATLTFTVQDDSGLESIEILDIVNATYSISIFSPGTTDPVTIVLTKISQANPFDVRFDITNSDGSHTTCDTRYPTARAVCESGPLPGVFTPLAADSLWFWGCVFDVPTGQGSEANAKIGALEVACLNDGAFQLDLSGTSRVTTLCDKE